MFAESCLMGSPHEHIIITVIMSHGHLSKRAYRNVLSAAFVVNDTNE